MYNNDYFDCFSKHYNRDFKYINMVLYKSYNRPGLIRQHIKYVSLVPAFSLFFYLQSGLGLKKI